MDLINAFTCHCRYRVGPPGEAVPAPPPLLAPSASRHPCATTAACASMEPSADAPASPPLLVVEPADDDPL